MKKLFILLGVALATQSCVKQPEASFTINPTTPHTGDAVNFSNSSKDAVSYKWDFGDGTTSSEVNPTHVYDYPGNYTVKLTAYSKKNKKTSTETKTINVEKGNEIYDAKNDKHYKISKVYVVNYGEVYNQNNIICRFRVIFATEGISYTPSIGITGIGPYIDLEMRSSMISNIDNGIYNYNNSTSIQSNTFIGDYEISNSDNGNIIGGNIIVSGDIFSTIVFDATKDNDFNNYLLTTSQSKLHVYYSGPTNYVSSNSKTSKLLSKK